MSRGEEIHNGTIAGRKVRTDKSRGEESKLEWTVERCVWAVGTRRAEIHDGTIPGARGKAE